MSLALIKIIFIITNLVQITTTTSTSRAHNNNYNKAEKFILTSCNLAVYQDVCVKSLTPYASFLQKKLTERQLVKLSIAVSLKSTNNAHKLISQHFHTFSKTTSLGECVGQLGSSSERLNASLHEFRITGTPRGGLYETRLNTVWGWLDAALSDTKDCKDSLADTSIGEARSTLKQKVNEADQTTSNALTLCNKLINSNSKP